MREVSRILIIVGGGFVLLVLAIFLVEGSLGENTDFQNVGDAAWFTLVTITTVGYGDISPSSFWGKVVAVLMFIFSVGVFSFMLTKIQSLVADFNRLRALGMHGTDFQDHVVVCSWSRIAMVAVKELLAADRQVAVIAEKAEDLPIIQELGDRRVLFTTVGDPTSEEALKRANIERASTVVAASQDDTLNLIVALEIKRLNPRARMVVSTKRAELRNTLTSSGVTYVASPFELSGRLVASAAFEPDVALFIEDVTSGANDEEGDDDGYDLQQFTLPEGCAFVGWMVGHVNAKLREIHGPLLVAVAKHAGGGKYDLFPHPTDQMPLNAMDSLVVLGNGAQNGRLAQLLPGVIQGR